MLPLSVIGALALAAALLPAAAAAQPDRIVARPEPGTPVVAAEVLLAVGPADEPEDQAGIAFLTARAVTAPVLPVLDSLGAHLEIRARKEALAFTVTASPDVWEEASRRVMAALFRDPTDPAAIERQRRELQAELEAREVSPADALVREVDAAVYGEDHPWGRPAVGYAATVAELTAPDVDLFLRRNFTPDRATVAVVGPVDPEAARRHVRDVLNAAPLEPRPVAAPTPVREPVRKQYSTITAWVSASWPFAPGADVEAIRLLGSVAAEGLSFGPRRRSVYNARSEVVVHPAGGELRLQLVVPPGEAEAWAARLREAVAEHAQAPLAPAVFADRLRRYRGARLLELESPEARARLLASRLQRTGARGGDVVDLDGLTPERLHEAARALSPAVVVFLGPWVEEEEAAAARAAAAAASTANGGVR